MQASWFSTPSVTPFSASSTSTATFWLSCGLSAVGFTLFTWGFRDHCCAILRLITRQRHNLPPCLSSPRGELFLLLLVLPFLKKENATSSCPNQFPQIHFHFYIRWLTTGFSNISRLTLERPPQPLCRRHTTASPYQTRSPCCRLRL